MITKPSFGNPALIAMVKRNSRKLAGEQPVGSCDVTGKDSAYVFRAIITCPHCLANITSELPFPYEKKDHNVAMERMAPIRCSNSGCKLKFIAKRNVSVATPVLFGKPDKDLKTWNMYVEAAVSDVVPVSPNQIAIPFPM